MSRRSHLVASRLPSLHTGPLLRPHEPVADPCRALQGCAGFPLSSPERPARDFNADFSCPYWSVIALKIADAEKADLGSGHLQKRENRGSAETEGPAGAARVGSACKSLGLRGAGAPLPPVFPLPLDVHAAGAVSGKPQRASLVTQTRVPSLPRQKRESNWPQSVHLQLEAARSNVIERFALCSRISDARKASLLGVWCAHTCPPP